MSVSTSVVTLTHNKVDCTRKCVGSLLGTNGASWELVVVDNGSTDGTCEWLEAFRREAGGRGVEVTLVRNLGNVGCSTARNQGIASSRGRYVAFVDNDVALRSRSWLRTLAGVLESDRSIAIAGPKLVYPFPPYAIQCAGAAVSRGGRVQFVGRGERRDDARFNRRRDAQCLISACFMVKRSVIEECGGFDEAFNPVEYEDIDLCYRVRSRGHRVVYAPEAEMYHFESVTTGGTPRLPNTYLIVKHGMEFKRRWRAMFEREDGPAESETKWKRIQTRDFAAVGELPSTD